MSITWSKGVCPVCGEPVITDKPHSPVCYHVVTVEANIRLAVFRYRDALARHTSNCLASQRFESEMLALKRSLTYKRDVF